MKTSLAGGYPCIRVSEEEVTPYIHNLVAIADGADPHKVYSGGYQVHHVDENKWLNSDTNLELMTIGDHRRHHDGGRTDHEPWTDEDTLIELRDRELTQYEMADELGCAQDTVSKWMNYYDIDTSRVCRESWQDYDTMYDMYVNQDMTMADMSDKLGCSVGTIHKWIDSLGVTSDARP